MALASLTVDLTLNLAKFEGDWGKAAQITTRDSERMSRAASVVEKALQKQADQVGRLPAEYAALQAAEQGLVETGNRFINVLARAEETATRSAKAGASIFSVGPTSAAEQALARQRDLTRELYEKLLQINEEYRKQRGLIFTAQNEGRLTPSGSKAAFEELDQKRFVAIRDAKSAAADQQAALAVQQAEAETLARRTAAFDNFLNNIRKKNQEREASEIAAVQRIADAQNGLSASYRQQAAALEALRGKLSPEQFDIERQKLFASQPSVVAAQKAAQEEIKAAQAVAAENEKRLASSQALLDVENGLTASYRRQIKELVALREAGPLKGGITDAQFAKLKAGLVESQPIIKARNEERAAIEAEEKAVASLIERLQGLGPAFAKQAEDLKAVQATAAAKLIPEKATGATSTPQTQAYLEEISASRKAAEVVVAQEEKKRAAQAETVRRFEENIKLQAQLLDYEPADRRVEGLRRQAQAIGANGAALEPFLKKLQEADRNMGKFGNQAGLTATQFLTLKYTISDVIASAASGISPLTILFQQGTQLAQVEGIFPAIARSITPFRLAIGGAATALGVLVAGFYEGQKQSRAFNDAITLSGNFAGITQGQFNALARTVAASSTVTIGAAREFGEALISTGQIGSAVFAKAELAAARFGAATGQNAKEVARDFASMSDSVTKWVTDHNKSLNLFSAAEILHIQQLEEGGRAIEAQSLVYDKLNKRLDDLKPNLGSLDRALIAVKKTWSEFWDSVYDIGRDETIEGKLEKARKALQNTAPASVGGPIELRIPNSQVAQQLAGAGLTAGAGAAARENQLEEYRLLSKSLDAEQRNKGLEATRKELTKNAAAAVEYAKSQLQAAHSAVGLDIALGHLRAQFKFMREEADKDPEFAKLTEKLRSPETEAAIEKSIREKFSDKKGINESDAQRKAQLAADIAGFKQQFDAEKATLDFHLKELDSKYRAGEISLKDYYDQKRADIAAGTEAELAELTKERDRFQAELDRGNFKDPHQRTDTERQQDAVVAQAAKVRLAAQREAVLANNEETASLIALDRRVEDYRANLAQLTGDEAKATQIRNAQATINDKLFQEQTKNRPNAVTDAELQKIEQARDIQAQYAEAQRKNSILSADAARAEELFRLRAEQQGLSLRETEAGIYQIRSAALSQLGELVEEYRRLAAAQPDNRRLAQDAADLAAAYAKAADSVSPFFNRLREETRSLSAEMASTIGNVFANWSSIYRQRTAQEGQAAQQQREAYDKQIADLNSYLRQTSDAKDAAFLKERIKDVQRQRDAVKSGGGEFLKTVQDVVLRPLAHQIMDTLTKVTITQPIQVAFEGYLNEILKKVFPGGTLAGDGALKSAQVQLVTSTGQVTGAQYKLLTSTDQLAYAADLASTALKQIAAQSGVTDFQGIDFGGIGGGGGGGFDTGAFEGIGQFFTGAKGLVFERGLHAFAMGDTFDSGIQKKPWPWQDTQMYAAGGQFTNTIVTQPTHFRFGHGASQLGLMGEAGAEAIMPLKRGKDGTLGVRMFSSTGDETIIPLKRGPDGSLGIISGPPSYGAISKSAPPGLDVGTNYVPYDNMLAFLHKGEAVVPAKFNPAAGGNAPNSGLIVNVHPAPGTEAQSIRRSDDGKQLDIVMRQTERFIAGRTARGGSPLNSGLMARGIDQNRGLSKRG